MNAHRLVIIAAALTIVVAAALASVLATFSGQAELGDITAHATLVSGRWPGRPASGQPIPAALHGAVLIVALTIGTAAFGLFIVIPGLALGSAERELTLARLTVMGHERPVELALAETMPAVLAAVIAGAVCAVALPHLVGLVCRPVRLLPGPAPRSSSHLMLSSSACPPPRSSSWPWPRCSRRLRCCADAALPACSGQTKR
jgi:hypothetical protein